MAQDTPATAVESKPESVQDAPEQPARLRMFSPKDEVYRSVLVAKIPEAQKRGYEPAWEPWESALAGVGQGATLGFGDEVAGAAGAAAQALGDRSLEGFGEHYKQNRDDARDKLAAAHAQNPKSYAAGEFGGTALPALVAPGGVAGALAFGAADGLGHSNADDVRGLAKDTAVGAGAGLAGFGATKVLGAGLKAAQPAIKNAAGKVLLSGAGIGAKDLGVESGTEAVNIAKHALDEPGLVPDVLSRKGASAANLAENAAQTTKAAGRAMGENHAAFDAVHGATIEARGLGQDIEAAGAQAMRVKPEMQRHVARAVRQIDPEAFDAYAVKLAKDKHVAELTVHRLKKTAESDPTVTPAILARMQRKAEKAVEAIKAFKANPSLAYSEDHMLTHGQAQEVIGRLKDLGAHSAMPNTEEVFAKNGVTSPAWNAGASAIRTSAETHGGPEALAAENAARARYAANIAMQHGAEKAAARQSVPQSIVPQGVAAAGRMAVGNLVNPQAGVGLAVAGPALQKAVIPRAAKALNNLANVNPEIAPHTANLGASYGSLFSTHPPERRVHLDHKLQELSPRYRAMRKKASEEVDNATKNK